MTFTEILDTLEIEYITEGHAHCRAGWIQLDCPLCTPNARHWRLGYNLEYGYANCWNCGRVDVFECLNSTGISRKEAYRLLRSLDKHQHKRKTERFGRLEIPKGVTELMPAHINYLRKRGFNASKIVRLWNVRGIGPYSKLKWRLYIPITRHGREVSWTTRAIGNNAKPRYINAETRQEAFPAKQIVYGMEYVRHATIIHEGPFDVWRTGPGAVCTFGVVYSRAQLLTLSRVPVRIICFDSEPDAQKRAHELGKLLSTFPGQTLKIALDSGKDAAEATEKEVRQLRRFLG
jgi:hypothetical protein